jgi:hypothetical protein
MIAWSRARLRSSLIDDLARHCTDVGLPDTADPGGSGAGVPDAAGLHGPGGGPPVARGIRHNLTVMLEISLVAVLCGARSLRAIMRWARAKTQQILGTLGVPDGD